MIVRAFEVFGSVILLEEFGLRWTLELAATKNRGRLTGCRTLLLLSRSLPAPREALVEALAESSDGMPKSVFSRVPSRLHRRG